VIRGPHFMIAIMNDEKHNALLAEMSAKTLTEVEIVERLSAYVGNVTGRQLQQLARIAAQSYADRYSVRSAVQALRQDAHRRGLISVSVGREGRMVD
jgi:hypothetical protein